MSKHDSHNTKILFVDDETDIVEVLKRGLEMNGYTVETYTKPEHALENYKPNYYDRIFLDIRMPGMNGFDLAHAIWRQDSDAKICFFSAFEIYEDEANKVFKDMNTKCFLKKPITTQGMIDHIEKHVINAS